MTNRPVLVVEDDADIRTMLCELLAAEGYAPIGAADGIEALDLMKNMSTPVLMLIDLMMPRMDGGTLIATIKANPSLADIPVIVMSGHAAASAAAKSAADAYLAKPFELDALLDVVHRLADGAASAILSISSARTTYR